MLLLAGCIAALGLGTGSVMAQGGRGGNFDPAAMRERYVSRVVDQMNITDDGEKKAISDAVGKVIDARMEVGRGGFGGGGRRNRGGGNGTSTDTSTTDQNNNNNRNRGGFGAPSAEQDDLQKALDDKSTTSEEIKGKLAKLRDANAAKQAKLESTQADLRKLLTARQEAVAVLNGLLK
jgi:hypothetical protein